MSDEIIKVLDDLSDRFGVAIDWSSQNVLPYLQELCDKYINYEIWTSVVYIVIFLLIECLALYGINKILSSPGYITDDDFGLFCLLGITAFLMLVFIICQIMDIITALTFPEKLIYEYIISIS